MNCARGRAPGQWWPLDCTPHWNDEPVGKKTPIYSAQLYCAKCGEPTTMINHKIDPSGAVSPSFVECKDAIRCGTTHEFLVLEGWPEFAAAMSAKT